MLVIEIAVLEGAEDGEAVRTECGSAHWRYRRFPRLAEAEFAAGDCVAVCAESRDGGVQRTLLILPHKQRFANIVVAAC